MQKFVKSFLVWAAAAVLALTLFIAGIGCKENGTHVFYDVIGWAAMAEAVAAVVCAIIIHNRIVRKRKEEEEAE